MSDSLLETENLSYRYDDGTQALQSVSLHIAAGEKVGLIGPNGAGKSTLLLCLSGLVSGDGVIRVEGEALTKSRAKEIRGRVGIVFQSPDDQLFMPTLRDDLAFGPINLGLSDQDVLQRVHESADGMRLTAMLDRAPHHMSMGQKRNAAIASVLAMRPAVLLIDEPSSNLDPRSRKRLIDVLQEQQAAMLIASHDLTLIERLCRRVLVIDGGRIVANGPTDDILKDAKLMEKHGLST